LWRRHGLAVGASGQELAVELRDESEGPLARSLGWIRFLALAQLNGRRLAGSELA
jgi:hypothetical protein